MICPPVRRFEEGTSGIEWPFYQSHFTRVFWPREGLLFWRLCVLKSFQITSEISHPS